MSKAFFKKLTSFRGKRSIEHTVGDTKLNFYPNHFALLETARDMSGPVARAISDLMVDSSRDSRSMVKRMSAPDVEGPETAEGRTSEMLEMQEVETDAVSVQMADFRAKQRGDAIESLITSMMDTKHRLLFGSLLMDSLREDFPYEKRRSAESVEYFLYGEEGEDAEYTGLDLPDFVAMLSGWMKANAASFGATGKRLVALAEQKLEGLNSAGPPLEEETSRTTSGEISKMPTSEPSTTASEPTSSTN